MKKFKRFTAILLSTILFMMVIPFSVFAGGVPDEIIYKNWDGRSEIYKYGRELQVGKNTFDGVDKAKLYFCSFVPQETGVYSFGNRIAAVTADTDDNVCSYKNDEMGLNLFPFEDVQTVINAPYAQPCKFLTAGTRYYVLFMILSNVEVKYYGTVTNVTPAHPLSKLVEDYDVESFVGNDPYLHVNEMFKFTFSDSTSAYHNGFNFYEYTDNTLTLNTLGFEKTFDYSIVSARDVIAGVYVDEPVELIKYFDGTVILGKPVQINIGIETGQPDLAKIAVVKFDAYDDFHKIKGENGRVYYLSLDMDENGDLVARAANVEDKLDYNLKKAGLFKNFLRYFECKKEIRLDYSAEMARALGGQGSILSVTKRYNEEIMELRSEFIKSIFSF